MINLTFEHIQDFLKQYYGEDTLLLEAGDIGSLDTQGMKNFGYGKPVRIRFRMQDLEREAVLSVMKGDKYGHQYYWDRAHILLFQYETSSRLPLHVKPFAVGYVSEDDALIPLENPQEFFILNEKVEGYDYFHDLDRIRKGDFRKQDVMTTMSLTNWLAQIHSTKLDDPELYQRRIRNLIGSDECIFGLVDEAFPHPWKHFTEQRFITLEKRIIDWRWRLKKHAGRLAVVHGDFHPWNILINPRNSEQCCDFRVLDRSRGEYGEPAGDVACLACNYLLFGLYENSQLEGPFLELWNTLFENYLDITRDTGMLEVIAPFFVFRGLVITSPEWYPSHPPEVRQGLLNFLVNVLEDRVFDWRNVNHYMETTA